MTKNSDISVTRSNCRSYILNIARLLDRAFTYKDLMLESFFVYGTLRNTISKLRKDKKILKLVKENPSRFILEEWKNRPEYKRWIESDSDPMGGGRRLVFDFCGFVESLDWSEVLYVHDVRVEFSAYPLPRLGSSFGWRWQPKSHSWIRRFDDFEFPLLVQVFDSGRVQVVVRCSLKPIPFGFEGLMRLSSVLGEVKGRLGWGNVPNVANWIVTSWHYGKDSLSEVSGSSFNVTFKTWSGALARIYLKSELKKVRAEEIQSPRRTIQDIFEEIVNRCDDVGKRGEVERT